jgi:hypothetical protein
MFYIFNKKRKCKYFKKSLWSAKHHVWREPGTVTTVKHGGGSIMLFFNGRDWEISKDQGKDEWSKVPRDP